MKQWYGKDVPKQSSGSMGVMMGGTTDSESEVASLSTAPDFDKTFLEQMIPHHQMAVMMANMLERGTNRSEMKNLAAQIISAQTKEISEMQSWQSDWGYTNSSQTHMMGH
jgi:uncharacterized protein (DUF305 family)